MYCPKCASQVADNQRFCRNCGLKLDVIVDAVEGRARGPLDFENLKRDLRDLGANLRAGFEEASSAIKRTQRLDKTAAPPGSAVQPVLPANWSRELSKAIGKVRVAHSRKYSLQQATLSIFGGGAWMAAWYYLLNAAADSGLLSNLELIILENTGAPVFGLIPVIRMLWLLGLIPIARGVAHLINGIFFAPKPEKEPEPQPGFTAGFAQSYVQPPPAHVSAVADPATNELENERNPQPQSSVTEDATLRFEPK
jgi:hypothetical protein